MGYWSGGRGGGLKHVLLDSNPHPLLLRWFETFVPHEGFLTHQRINTGNKQIVIKTYGQAGLRTRQKQRFVTPGDP